MKTNRTKRDADGIIRRVMWTVVAIALGVALAVASYFLAGSEPWWSNLLANGAVVILLLTPGEWILSRLTREIVKVDAKAERIETTANEAKNTANEAIESARETAQSLQDVRQAILDRQHEELSEEKQLYESLVTDPSRENIIRVLSAATSAELISARGVRAPLWETELHYRYVLDPAGTITVQIEDDGGAVLATEIWEDGVTPTDFFQRLVLAVRTLGADLGTGLNDPTESLERVSEMLVRVVGLRSQELLGHRHTLKSIIEYRDGWYFTERLLMSTDHNGYTIPVGRLNEMDWERHLYEKGWGDGAGAVEFARRFYNVPRPEKFDIQ